ncbi:MAG: thioredoxin family protein [Lentisphaeria bacterium]|nr:thioredoxin family protein [Lentisphaeria bacterium]
MKKFYLLGLIVVCVCTLFCSNAYASKKKSSKNRTKTEKKVKTSKKSKKVKNAIKLTDFKLAQEMAKEKKLPVMLVFTGSDWCGPCQALNRVVFDSAEFKKWSAKKVVPILADFPKRTKQSDDLKAQNAELKKKYPFSGYPTVTLLTPEGEIIGKKTGFGKYTAQTYIAEIEKILASKK